MIDSCSDDSGVVQATARSGHTMTRLGERLFAFGGMDNAKYLQDLQYWSVRDRQWRNCFVSGETPPPRSKHTMNAFGDNKMILFGGGDESKLLNDVYIFDAGKKNENLFSTLTSCENNS